MDQITVAGMTIETKYVFFTWLGMLILLITGLVLRKKLQACRARRQVPDLLRKTPWWTAWTPFRVRTDLPGKEGGAARFVPLLASIFIYVLTMNLLGLVPGCDAPTANLNTTISIALCVFIYYNYVGIRTWGFGYIHHFTGSSKPLNSADVPPVEIISHLARPLSMSLRLFGNIFAEEMTLIIFFGFGASIYVGVLLGTVPMYFLFLLGKVLQAFILFILSMIYIQGSVEHAH